MAGKQKKITLTRVVKTNIDVLNRQEAELKKLLDLVKETKKLFRKNAVAGTAKKTGRKRGRPRKKAVTAKRTRRSAGRKKAARGTAPKGKGTPIRPGSRLADIFSALKRFKGKAGSGDVIRTMFESQSKIRNFNLFRQRIYPVLTRAYKSGTLVLRDGKIEVPS